MSGVRPSHLAPIRSVSSAIERLLDTQEVSGLIPLPITNKRVTMPFLTELKYEPAKGTNIWGRPQFSLTAPLEYDHKGYILIRVPEGFKTDFATIPSWIPFLKPKNGKWAKASVVHDYLCKRDIPKVTADKIFYYAMLDDGANVFTAYVLWASVRINHIAQGQG